MISRDVLNILNAVKKIWPFKNLFDILQQVFNTVFKMFVELLIDVFTENWISVNKDLQC